MVPVLIGALALSPGSAIGRRGALPGLGTFTPIQAHATPRLAHLLACAADDTDAARSERVARRTPVAPRGRDGERASEMLAQSTMATTTPALSVARRPDETAEAVSEPAVASGASAVSSASPSVAAVPLFAGNEVSESPVSEWLPVLALCCAIAAVCTLDRVVISIAIIPMSVQYGFEDSTKGLIAAAFSVG